ncbi:hypothetical protein GCM10023116_40820 [Kistimonas scapharcae]|uniref:Putative adhesin Stv domain-containing protein n=1 Tax=Kistimonas scapharcae TaxID=1036133 RepID=A0ABP8V6C2_9GAMM
MTTCISLGSHIYLFKDDSGTRADHLLITSHGTSPLTNNLLFVPEWTTLYFYNPPDTKLCGIENWDILSGRINYFEKRKPHDVVYNYLLSKYQSKSDTETYESISSDIELNRLSFDIIAGTNKHSAELRKRTLQKNINIKKFDILTIRKRLLGHLPYITLNDVLTTLMKHGHIYTNIHCSFCRSHRLKTSVSYRPTPW